MVTLFLEVHGTGRGRKEVAVGGRHRDGTQPPATYVYEQRGIRFRRTGERDHTERLRTPEQGSERWKKPSEEGQVAVESQASLSQTQCHAHVILGVGSLSQENTELKVRLDLSFDPTSKRKKVCMYMG